MMSNKSLLWLQIGVASIVLSPLIFFTGSSLLSGLLISCENNMVIFTYVESSVTVQCFQVHRLFSIISTIWMSTLLVGFIGVIAWKDLSITESKNPFK